MCGLMQVNSHNARSVLEQWTSKRVHTAHLKVLLNENRPCKYLSFFSVFSTIQIRAFSRIVGIVLLCLNGMSHKHDDDLGTVWIHLHFTARCDRFVFSLKIHGTGGAYMLLIAKCSKYQRKGMCRQTQAVFVSSNIYFVG